MDEECGVHACKNEVKHRVWSYGEDSSFRARFWILTPLCQPHFELMDERFRNMEELGYAVIDSPTPPRWPESPVKQVERRAKRGKDAFEVKAVAAPPPTPPRLS